MIKHGLLVKHRYVDLISHLRDKQELQLPDWRLPDWINNPILLEDLPDDEIMASYHIYHDCGKPYCLTIDEDGKRHFPDHANVSADCWISSGGSVEIAELIRSDMLIHTIKDADVDQFSQNKYACALILTGLAEIHANASMFGGIESTSFKIKYKQIDKRGSAILKKIHERKTRNGQ